MPGSPATPQHPTARRFGYGAVAVLLSLTGGLGNALVAANLPQIQGALGLTPVEAAWLPTVYLMTNVSMSLLLIKFRQQYGLALFIRIFLTAMLVVTLAHLVVNNFPSALAVRAISGMAASALSTLTLYYMIQALPALHRMRALVIGVSLPQVATPLARLFSTDLLQTAQWHTLYLFESGLVLLSLAAVGLLPLPPSERNKAFEPLDFLTFALFAPGIALLCAVLGLGRVVWWTQAAWIGWALCGAVLLIGAAVTIEHQRRNPLINTRWIGSGDIVRFAVVAVLVRVVLSEQSVTAVGLLQVLGVSGDLLHGLFGVILLATIAGAAVSALTLNVNRLGNPIAIALLLILMGSLIDARSTNLARPEQFYTSQALLAFAGALFLGPALLIGITRALARGPAYIVSFSVLFGITQSLGGLGGSALLGSVEQIRAQQHAVQLQQNLRLDDPQVASRLQLQAGAYGRVVTDPALRNAQGLVSLNQQLMREAHVLAYNDVFRLIAAMAGGTLLWIIQRIVRDRRRARLAATAAVMPAAVPAGAPT